MIKKTIFIQAYPNLAGKIFVLCIIFLAAINLARAQGDGEISWREAQDQEKSWYGSEEAQRIADNVLLYQNDNGGWIKNVDMSEKLDEARKAELKRAKTKDQETTIDNGATYTQLRYLAKVYQTTGKERYKEAFLKGVEYLLAAQYENGGWPQFFPVREGYYEHITFNDGAMIGVMELLRNVAKGEEPYHFVKAELSRRAWEAIERGLQVILDSQVRVDGKLTAWAAQHDKDDLKPAKARAYELPSLSGKESAGIVEYLLELEHPGEDVKRAIRDAVAWFEKTRIEGKEVVWIKDESLPEGKDRIVVNNPDAGPLWARFYEIGSNKPIFVGRDGIVRNKLSEIEHERRINYSYIDDYAEDLLEEDYPAWEESNK